MYALVIAGTFMELVRASDFRIVREELAQASVGLAAALLLGAGLWNGIHRVTNSTLIRALAVYSALAFVFGRSLLFLKALAEVNDITLSSSVSAALPAVSEFVVLTACVGVVAAGLAAFRRAMQNAHRLEEQLAETEAARHRFEQIARISGEVIWEVDAQGNYKYVSPASETVYGYKPEELIGKKALHELHPTSRRDLAREFYQNNLKGERAFSEYLRLVKRADGTAVEVVTSGTPVLREDGVILGYLGSDRDVSELHHARAQQRLLSRAVDCAAEAILVTDIGGRILYVNPAFERTTGYSRDEALGCNPRFLKSGHQSQAFYEHMWGILQRGELWQGHFTNRNKSGRLFDEEATIAPIRDESGEVRYFVGIKRDVTRQRELERQLCQRIRYEAVGSLASGIAQEFKSVSAIMIGHTEIALERLGAEHSAREPLEEVLRTGYKSAELVRKLLEFSRRHQCEAGLQLLAPLIDEAIELIRGFAPADISIHRELQPEIGLVLLDPIDLQQVLLNLCVNAFQAMAGEGRVTVRAAATHFEKGYEAASDALPPGDYVQIEVEDTGSGMDETTIARIFEPFFTTKSPGENSGLGLRVVADIVRGWRGAMEVSSQPGCGTLFRIYLPRVSGEPGVAAA